MTGVPSKHRTQTTKSKIGSSPLRLSCVFFKTEAGNEPVRDWLKEGVPVEARRTIGTDIKTVQATWPIDKPFVDFLGHGLRVDRKAIREKSQ